MNLTGFPDFADYTADGAYLLDARPYEAVLRRLHGMTTPSVMHLLNQACRRLEPGEIYLEVGCYRGSTLIGALLDNQAWALAIDDRSNSSHDGLDNASEFWRNVGRAGVVGRVIGVVRANVHDVFSGELLAADVETAPYGNVETQTLDAIPPVGVLMLDGNHADAGETLRSLRECIPYLAPRAVIVMDDANMPKIHEAAHAFVESDARASLLFDRRTPGHQHPSWWNGTIVIGWEAHVD